MALHRYGDFRVEVFYFDSPCISSSVLSCCLHPLPLPDVFQPWRLYSLFQVFLGRPLFPCCFVLSVRQCSLYHSQRVSKTIMFSSSYSWSKLIVADTLYSVYILHHNPTDLHRLWKLGCYFVHLHGEVRQDATLSRSVLPASSANKKLSYRRETARQLRTSTYAGYWSCNCNAQDTAESQRLYYFSTFKRSDSRSAGRKRILTWNSHSRSFTLQSVTSRQGVAYRHNYIIACRISDVFEDVAT